jgi:hypothetical protein
MNARLIVVGTLVTLVALHGVAAAQEPKVELELQLSSSTAPLGRAVGTRLVFVNSGYETTYIRLPRGSELEFNLEVDTCRFRLFQFKGDMSIDSLRFLYIPLFSGARYEIQGANINDGSFPPFGIRFPRAGDYQIRLKWRSRADYVEGGIWPIWRDPVDAPTVKLRVGPPDPSEVDRFRRAVLLCTNDACDEDALAFFSLAQDRQVAERIAQLFKTEPPEGRFELVLAQAIARQGREADLDLLRQRADLGNRTSSSVWNAWTDLVERVGGREPCPR